MIVVARNDNWVAVRIDTADDTDMAATAASHHGDGTDLRAGDAGPVARVSACEIPTTCMPGALKHQVHESAAPKAAAPCGVGPDIFARLGNQGIAGRASIGRIRVRLCPRPGIAR